MRTSTLLIITSAAWFGLTSLAAAAVTNGDFETGSLSGWSHIGFTHTDNSASGVTPSQGTYDAFIDNTGNFAADISAVVPFLGVPGTSILALLQGPPTTGSAISQDITVSAGDVLSFDWNFLTDEWNEDPGYNDFAIFTIGTDPYFLASRGSTHATLDITSPPPGFDGQTHWANQTYTFTSTGTFKLGFAVFNVGDAGHDSLLLVDAVSVSAVPESGSFALVIAGAAMVALHVRRRTSLASLRRSKATL